MKVLHLLHSLNPGGVETWLLRMLRQIPRTRIAMDVCCRDEKLGLLTDEARATGAKVMSVPWANVLTKPWKVLQIEFVQKLTRILREGEYDLLHVHTQFVSGLAAVAAKSARVTLVSTIHRTTPYPDAAFSTNWALRAAYRLYLGMNMNYSFLHAARVMTDSRGAMDRMVGRWARDQRFSVVLPGVEPMPDVSTADRERFRTDLGWPADCPLVLHVGRFDEGKNQRGVVEVFKQVRANCPDARLILVGDGPLRAAILQFIDETGLTSEVRWLGIRRDVPAIMCCSDILLFPSHTESLPIAVLEAAAAGLPIVGSRIPGLEEAVINGSTAYLHPVSDHSAMAGSVLRLLTDRSLSREFRQNARRHCEQSFSLSAAADRLESVYREALSSRKKAA